MVNNQAKDLGLKVLIDLHTAPGSQNGFDNSGRAGDIKLLTGNNLVEQKLSLEALSSWCRQNLDQNTVWGIESLNEAAGFIDMMWQAVKD